MIFSRQSPKNPSPSTVTGRVFLSSQLSYFYKKLQKTAVFVRLENLLAQHAKMEVQGALVSRYFPSKTHQCLREDGHLLQGQVCVEPIDPSSDGHEEGMHAVRHLTRTKNHGKENGLPIKRRVVPGDFGPSFFGAGKK